MATEGPVNLATWTSDDSVGTIPWTDPDNARLSDLAFAAADVGTDTVMLSLRLIRNGELYGEELAANESLPLTEDDIQYNVNLSFLLTGADVKAANFGVVIQISGSDGESEYLKGLDAAFSVVPDTDRISDITIIVRAMDQFGVQHVNLTITYGPPPAQTVSDVEKGLGI